MPTLRDMATPSDPVQLSPQQIEELMRKFATLRHDINNHLSLIVAATELVRANPASIQRMAGTLSEQPNKITDLLNRFSLELESSLGAKRP